MYESFFGFSRRPFTAPPDADCYVPVSTTQEAVAELLLCVRQGDGIAVLTAPAGLGKSLVCRHLAGLLREDFSPVVLPQSGFDSSAALLQAVLYELGHAWTGMSLQELRLELQTALAEAAGDECPVVLLFDEAHRLEPPLLEEIRCLADLQQGGKPLVRIVLCGQLELEESLALPENNAFNQRIRCQATLPPLSRLESAEYLLGRLQQVGSDLGDVFTREAVQLICRAADGNPRCLNQLCDQALLMASIAEESPVTEQTVRDALDDVQQLPLHWNIPAGRDVEEVSDETSFDETDLDGLTDDEAPRDDVAFPDDLPTEAAADAPVAGTADATVHEEFPEAPAAFETAEPAVASTFEPLPTEQAAVVEVGEPLEGEMSAGAAIETSAGEPAAIETPAVDAGLADVATTETNRAETNAAGAGASVEWPSLEVGALEVGAQEPAAEPDVCAEAADDDSEVGQPAPASGVLELPEQNDFTTGHENNAEAVDFSDLGIGTIAETESSGDSMFHREPGDSFAPPAPVAAFECGAEEVADERNTARLGGHEFPVPVRPDAAEPLHEAATAGLDATELAMMEEMLAESCMAADASLPDDATAASESATIDTDLPDTSEGSLSEVRLPVDEAEGSDWEAPCIEFGIDDADEGDDWASGSWTSLETGAEADELAEFLTFDQPAITTSSPQADDEAEAVEIDPELEWELQLELAAESAGASEDRPAGVPPGPPADGSDVMVTSGNSITPQVPPVLWSVSGDDGFGSDDDSWQPEEWLPPDLVVPQGDGWVSADAPRAEHALPAPAGAESTATEQADQADSSWQPVSLDVTRNNSTTVEHHLETGASARPVPGQLGPSREVEALHPESGEVVRCREQEVLDPYAQLAAAAASEQDADAGEQRSDHPSDHTGQAPADAAHREPVNEESVVEEPAAPQAEPARDESAGSDGTDLDSTEHRPHHPVHGNPLEALDNVSQLINAALRPTVDDSADEYFHPETVERLIEDGEQPHRGSPQVADHTGSDELPAAESATRDLDALSRLAGDQSDSDVTGTTDETSSAARPTYHPEAAGESLEEQIGRSVLDTSIDAQRVVEQRLDQAISEERQATRPQVDDWQPVDPSRGTELGEPAPADRTTAGPQIPPVAASQGLPPLPVDPPQATTETGGERSTQTVHGTDAGGPPDETLISSGRRRFARLFTDLRLRQSGRSQRTGRQ